MLEAVDGGSSGDPVARAFFNQLLENTMEGYFGDPVHGGNRFAAGWKMIGFPGCGHDYRSHVGRNVDVASLVPVQSIAMVGKAADADPA